MRGGLEKVVDAFSQRRTSSIEPYHSGFEVIGYKPLFESPPDMPVLFTHHKPARPIGKKKGYDALAHFYEGLTKAIYGATHVRPRLETDSGEVGYPDLIDTSESRARETKAISTGSPLDIRDHQIGYLGEFQYAHPNYRVSFHTFRYRKPEIPMKKMSPHDLLNFLTRDATAFSLNLPLSLVHHLYRLAPNTKDLDRGSYVFRYEQKGPRWQSRTRVHSGAVNNLAIDPLAFIEKLGLNPDDYKVSFGRLSKPVRCHGVLIARFPIISVTDKNHSAWVKSFIEGYPNNLVSSYSNANKDSKAEVSSEDLLLGLPF